MAIIIRNWYTGWFYKMRLRKELERFLKCVKEFKKMKKLITLVLILFAAIAIADSPCTFTWDPNTEADLAGYRIYFSETEGQYTTGGTSSPNFLADIPCGPNDSSCCVYVKASLGGGAGYFFVATAYDTDGFESEISNEVNNLPPGKVKNLKSEKGT